MNRLTKKIRTFRAFLYVISLILLFVGTALAGYECPDCGETIPECTATICPACGATLNFECPDIRGTLGIKLKESKNNGVVTIAHFKTVGVDVTKDHAAQFTIFEEDGTGAEQIGLQSGTVTPAEPTLVINNPGVEKFILELDLEAEELTGKYKLFDRDKRSEYTADIQASELDPNVPIIQGVASVNFTD